MSQADLLKKSTTTTNSRPPKNQSEKENYSSNLIRWMEESKIRRIGHKQEKSEILLPKEKSLKILQAQIDNVLPQNDNDAKKLKYKSQIERGSRKSFDLKINQNPTVRNLEGKKDNFRGKENKLKLDRSVLNESYSLLNHSKVSLNVSRNSIHVVNHNESYVHGVSRLSTMNTSIISNNTNVLNTSTSNAISEVVERESMTTKLVSTYGSEILEYYKKKCEEADSYNFLENHPITSNLRSRMIDWMIEVLYSYKCKDQTFFMSVMIMDNFLKHTKTICDVNEIHLIGVTCMFIASKYEEIYPFKLKMVHEKIGHKKISIEKIKKTEKEILESLDFNLCIPSSFEFLNATLQTFFLKQSISNKNKTYLEKICVYLLKMILHDYELIGKLDIQTMVFSTIIVGFKICEQMENKLFSNEKMIEELKNEMKVDEESVYNASKKILHLAKNFEKLYPNLENLKKFNGFSLSQKTSSDLFK